MNKQTNNRTFVIEAVALRTFSLLTGERAQTQAVTGGTTGSILDHKLPNDWVDSNTSFVVEYFAGAADVVASFSKP